MIMTSRLTGMLLGLGAAAALFGAVVVGLRPEAQEPGVEEMDDVTPNELQLYIDVYAAMQADHDLMVDTVLTQKGMTLAQFRAVERRVQRDDRLVRKVREALMTQAKTRGEQIAPLAAKPPAAAAPAADDVPAP